MYLLGGTPLVTTSDLPTFSVTENSGTLVSGQEFTSKLPTAGPGYPAVIFCHSAGGAAADMLNAGPIDDITTLLAGYGFPCLGLELHDESWGNDQSRADIDEGWAYAISDLDADASQVAFLGISMGGWASFSWASQNASDVLCIATIVGVADADTFYTNGGVGAQNSVNAAYGGAPGWVSAQPTHDPLALALAGDLDGVHCCMWYGVDDNPGIDGTATNALAAAIGSTALVRPNIGSHLPAAANVNRAAVCSYFLGQHLPTARARKPVT